MTIRVAYNASSLIGALTGIGQYVYQLALQLTARDDLQMHLFYAGRFERGVRPRGNLRTTQLRRRVREVLPWAYDLAMWQRQRRFTQGARTIGFDLYHEPNFVAFRFDGPLVLTVHDLSWIRYPQTHPADRVRAMHRYFEPSLRRASIVLTDSQFVKDEVVQVFGVDPSRVRAVPIGLDPAFHPMTPGQTRATLQAHGVVHGGYLLSVGTLEPRKNLERTVEAYGRLPSSLRARFPLVIVGAGGWHTQGIRTRLQPLVDRGEAKVLGYVAREDLVALTAGAAALVYPSIYEGFGLPPLEAMGCGVATIASNVSSLPEVVGDCGLLVDPFDVDAISAAMRRMLEDEALRASLGIQAAQRAGRFTWEGCAVQTRAAYADALASSR